MLVVTPDFPPSVGGIQRLLHRLLQNFSRVEAGVLTIAADGAQEFDASEGINVRRVVVRPQLGRKAAIARLNAEVPLEVRRLRPAVVLSGHIVMSPAATWTKHALGVPYIQYVYGWEAATPSRLTRLALRGASAVVAISRYTERLALVNGAPPEKVHLVPPGVEAHAEAAFSRSDHPTVITVGRMSERYKGHDVLIRAMPLVRSRFPTARLVVVGDGPLLPSYRELASALGLEGSVEFCGRVDDATRDRLLHEAHVFALPSRVAPDGGAEGFGIVYLEAAAHRLPVVAGRVGGAVDAVDDGKTGQLVDPGDHVEVGRALIELLADPERAQAYGRHGAERAAQFSWPAVARRVEDILLKVAGA